MLYTLHEFNEKSEAEFVLVKGCFVIFIFYFPVERPSEKNDDDGDELDGLGLTEKSDFADSSVFPSARSFNNM